NDQHDDSSYPAYSLLMDVSIANVGDQLHKVAYRLEGPTGLPTEGAWYASKVTWGEGGGLRDVIVHFEGAKADEIGPSYLANPEYKKNWVNQPLEYAAVDAQYFSSALIPLHPDTPDARFADVRPVRVGAIPTEKSDYKLINVSFRLDSAAAE